MMALSFSLPGIPRPKARARVTSRGTYTPKLTRDYENAVKFFASVALGAAVGWRSDGLFKVTCVFTFAKGTLADLDNLVKSVTDALQSAGVLDNDRQVVQVFASKELGAADRTAVRVERVGDKQVRGRR